MLVSTKSIGSKKKLFADFSVPLPPAWDEDGGRGDNTLRDLIEQVVRCEVKAFQKRQSGRQFVRALTATEIEAALDHGKVEMSGSEIGIQEINEDHAVGVALDAFEDGLYLVVVDDVKYENLDQVVFITDDSQLTFIRLTLLSGA